MRPLSGHVPGQRLLVVPFVATTASTPSPRPSHQEIPHSALRGLSGAGGPSYGIGAPATETVQPTVVRYVPEKRCLLRVTTDAGVRLAKVYARDEDLAVAEVQARLWRTATTPDGPVVPAVLGVLPALRLVVQETAAGELLYDCLRQGVEPNCLQPPTARALAVLHRAVVPGLRRHGIAESLVS